MPAVRYDRMSSSSESQTPRLCGDRSGHRSSPSSFASISGDRTAHKPAERSLLQANVETAESEQHSEESELPPMQPVPEFWSSLTFARALAFYDDLPPNTGPPKNCLFSPNCRIETAFA